VNFSGRCSGVQYVPLCGPPATVAMAQGLPAFPFAVERVCSLVLPSGVTRVKTQLIITVRCQSPVPESGIAMCVTLELFLASAPGQAGRGCGRSCVVRRCSPFSCNPRPGERRDGGRNQWRR